MSNKQSGQVTVIAALCMIAFIGVAAFCVNASYMFYQHTQMQAQVDGQTKYAAGNDSCSGSPIVGLTLQSPPTTGPYIGKASYCEGFYQADPKGLFGSLLRFPIHISVHAVALGGVTTNQTNIPAVLALNNTGCSLWVQSGNATLNIAGISGINYPATVADGCLSKDTSLTGTPPTTAPPSWTNPFSPNGPVPSSSSGLPYTVQCGNTGKGCPADDYNNFTWLSAACRTLYLSKYGLPSTPESGVVYEFPRAKGAIYNAVLTGDSKVKTYYFMPWCNGTSINQGMYEFFSSVTSLSSQTSVYTEDSTLIFAPGAGFSNSGQVSLFLDGPADITDPFYDTKFKQGIVLYQIAGSSCPEDTFTFNGSVSSDNSGIIDLPCTFLNYSGNSISGFGDIALWELEVTGSGTVTIQTPNAYEAEYLPRGAFLTQ